MRFDAPTRNRRASANRTDAAQHYLRARKGVFGDMIVRVMLPNHRTILLKNAAELDRWQHLLRNVYRTGDATCFCVSSGVALSICRLRLGSGERYYLRSHPSVSHLHHRGCLFGPEASNSHAGSARDGLLRLEGGLKTREVRERTSDPVERRKRPSRARGPETSYLELARHLIERAGLNEHDPQKRPRSVCAVFTRLRAASHIRTSAGDLADLLLLVPPGGEPDELAPFTLGSRIVLDRAERSRRRVVVIGEIGSLDQPRGEVGRLFIKGLERDLGWHCAWRREQASSALRRFRHAASSFGAAGARVLFVGSFDLEPAKKTLWLRHGALMLTAKPMIPLDSSHELTVALALMREGRHFRKPLSQTDDTLPDFELLDVGEAPVPMEVFGMNTAEYIERARAKTAMYDTRYGTNGWWRWDVTRQQSMPSFPTRSARAYSA